jgi:6-pyruvoyl-tetrahydropterin synthase
MSEDTIKRGHGETLYYGAGGATLQSGEGAAGTSATVVGGDTVTRVGSYVTTLRHTVILNHNMEIAHRLYLQPGKCQRIHGHSMKVTLTLTGIVNDEGTIAGADFADIKRAFRNHLDHNYDHHLLLNRDDPFARRFWLETHPFSSDEDPVEARREALLTDAQYLPGLQRMNGDPTTENLAKWIFEEMAAEFMGTGLTVESVHIQETPHNAVECRAQTVVGART